MEWTEERVEILKTLWTAGNTAVEVSRHLGVTRNAVIGKVHRLGLGGRQAPAAPRAIAVRTARRSRATPTWTRVTAPTPAPPAPRPRPVDAQELAPTAILTTLHVHSCRWPIGHPDDADFGFCGRDRTSHTPYCSDHQTMAFRRASRPVIEDKQLARFR